MKPRQQNIQSLRTYYEFSVQDAHNLQALHPIIETELDAFLDAFYKYVYQFKHANFFIENQSCYHSHRIKISEWFLNLFCGTYDEAYFENLLKISVKHVQIGLPSHYVNACFSFIRRYTKGILRDHQLNHFSDSFDKILDMNLDYITVNFHDSEQVKIFEMVEIIDHAIKHNTITPYLQAIVDTQSKKVAKYEALMRVTHSNGVVYTPKDLLRVAHKLERYNELSRLMLSNTLNYMSDKKIPFNLNVTFEDIQDPKTHALLINYLQDKTNNLFVTFEIVETNDHHNIDKVAEFCQQVHALGARIAIDDFGSGFSNYDRVLALKPDYIKIDGSLIKEIHLRNEYKQIVKALVKWAQKLNIKIVAEYVHCKEVDEQVEKLKIDFVQGFLYSEPQDMKTVL